MVMKFNECCSKIKRKSTMLIAYGSKANRVSRLKDIRDPVSLLWQRKKKKLSKLTLHQNCQGSMHHIYF